MDAADLQAQGRLPKPAAPEPPPHPGDVPESAFQSVIFFIGDCQFKTPMPPNVLSRGLRSWIENHRDVVLGPEQVAGARDCLANHDPTTDRKAAARQHLKTMKQCG
jgi:hypothetical protein